MTYDHQTLLEWLFGGPDPNGPGRTFGTIYLFGLVSLALLLIGLLYSVLKVSFTHGPREGFYRTVSQLFSVFTGDLPRFSLSRTLAISRLMLLESFRARVWVAVVVFFVLLMFAGWFLDNRVDHPVRRYITFVVFSSTLLLMLVGMFLSTLSLPNDIERRTIYTVVTKPVRPLELVLGRILGFMAVGTLLILIMGPVSYIFVSRSFQHSHVVLEETLQPANPDRKEDGRLRGRTSTNAKHSHDFVLDKSGNAESDISQEHFHVIERGPDGKYTVGPPLGQLVARVPHYGRIKIRDRLGKEEQKGINVGFEWDYRGFIEGGTPAEFEWTFEGLNEADYPDGLPLELTIRIFRTFKGDIEKTVLGRLIVRCGDDTSNLAAAPLSIRPAEFDVFRYTIPTKLKRLSTGSGPSGELKLFGDLVKDGRVKIALQCAEPAQYYGAARPDMYIRGRDASFEWNFAKAFIGVWLQFVVVVVFGVMFSTFLKGPVALVSTFSALVIGYFSSFIREMGMALFDVENPMKYEGGGPIESLVRLLTQANISQPLEVHPVADKVIKGIDTGFTQTLFGMTYIFPRLSDFDLSNMLAYGYHIDSATFWIAVIRALAYVVGATFIGYLIFKNREVAA
jgi:ABC-type transport system involved in multi-copper enzyme maturation permease subunit